MRAVTCERCVFYQLNSLGERVEGVSRSFGVHHPPEEKKKKKIGGKNVHLTIRRDQTLHTHICARVPNVLPGNR